jgi:colicin import membrane protein
MTAEPSLSLVPADEPIPHPVQPYVEANPGSVLLYPKVREAFLAEIKAEIEAFEPDLSTRTSRAEIASLAFKVAKTKAPIEAAAKSLTEGFRKRTAAVNAERKDVLDKLDTLRDLARAPLDKWEEEEKAREAKLKETFDAIDTAMRVLASDTSESVKARIYQMEAIEDNEDFHDARERALDTLTAAYERLLKDEADRAELARLRAEQAERQRQEAAAEAKRVADAEIARLNAEKQEMERAEATRIAEAKRVADEELARKNDRTRRAGVMTEAKIAIMRIGSIDEATAANIVKAIVAGGVPYVSVNF